MTITQAIEKAVKGGLDLDDFPPVDLKHLCIEDTAPLFLSRHFWQCLGKKMGWDSTYHYCKKGCGREGNTDWDKIGKTGNSFLADAVSGIEWRYRWHHFIQHLAEGKSAEEWFKNLK